MTRFAVEWQAVYPSEFGGGTGWVVSADACRRAEAERDRFRRLLTQVLEFTERYVSVDSPWTREVREALGLPAAAFDAPNTLSAAPSAPDDRSDRDA